MADGSTGLTRRQTRAVILVGIVVGGIAAPVLAGVFMSPVPQSGTVPYETNTGATINVQGDVNTSSGNPFTADDTVHIETSDGNATFTASGDVNATVTTTNLTGTWTTVTALNVSATRLVIDPEDKQAVGVEGDTDRLEFRQDITADDGTADVVYAGASGSTTVEIRGLNPDTHYLLRDADTGDVLGGGQTDGSGTVVMSGLPNSEHTAELETNDPPNFDSTSAEPTGSQDGFPSELSINVSDPDMPGDNVSVEFYLNGQQVGQDSRDTTGEVNTTIDPPRGTNEWYAVATDEAGDTTQSKTFEFETPANVTIRNETSPNEIIDDREVRVTFYWGDQVENRTTTDGNISLDGLPTDTRIHIEAEADGYYDRTITIERLSDQTDLYLLNDSDTAVSTVDVRFKLDDQTGNYPSSSTVLEVQKPITQDGTTTYRVVSADEFGVNGFVTTLEQDVRYRLVIRNADNDVRVLGTYTAPTSETVTLTVGSLQFDFVESDSYSWNASYHPDSETVVFNYSDADNATEDLNLKIYKQGNESVVVHDQQYPGPFGTLSVSEQVPAEHNESAWVVEWDAAQGDETISGRFVVGPRTSVLPELDDFWKQVASLLMLFMTAALFSRANGAIGSVAVAICAGWLWYVQWLGGATSGAAIVIAIGTAVWVHTSRQQPRPV